MPSPSVKKIILRAPKCILNEADKSPLIRLSNGGLTATLNSGGNVGVRANHSATSGKKFFSAICTVEGAATSIGVGVCNASASMTAQVGGDINGGITLDGGQFLYNSGVPFGLAIWAVGNVQDIAVDITAKKIWTRTNGGAWSQGGDPSTGSIGGDISGITGALFPVVGLSIANDSFTLNFKGPFTYPPPVGYGLW